MKHRPAVNHRHPSRPLQLRSVGQTDLGKRRRNNEDAYLADPALGLYVVADGMGGHAAGEVAARMAVDLLAEAVAAAPLCQGSGAPFIDPQEWLGRTVQTISAAIYATGQADTACRGMGSTLVAVLIPPRAATAYVASVGDSRVYLRRPRPDAAAAAARPSPGRLATPRLATEPDPQPLQQLTIDHTLGQLLLSTGQISAAELRRVPQRGMLTRALGTAPQVAVDTLALPLLPGDRLLLCSDGLHNLVPPAVVHELLGQDPLDLAAASLIEASLRRGGHDNVTAVLIEVHAPVLK